MQYKHNSKEKIWDLSLRLFHITLILLITGSIVTAKLNFLEIHQFFGVSLIGLISFRILWGFIGTNYSRFKSLNLSVSDVLNQLSSKKNVCNIKTTLGSYSTLVFMVILITLTISGLFSSDDVLYDGPLAHLTPNHTFYWVRIHDYSHYILYCLISLHIIAILYYQKVKKHNLIKRMFGFYYKIDQHISSKNNETPLKGVFILLICTILPSLFLILTN